MHTRTFVNTYEVPPNVSLNSVRARISRIWSGESLVVGDAPSSSSSFFLLYPQLLSGPLKFDRVFLRPRSSTRGWTYFTIRLKPPTLVGVTGKELALASEAYILVLTFDPIDPKLAI